MSNFKSNNTSLAMLALYGSPEQLKDKLNQRTIERNERTENKFIQDDSSDLEKTHSSLSFCLEDAILEMMEYDKIFGNSVDSYENPFKMEYDIPEDTTNYTEEIMDEYYNQSYLDDDNHYTTDSSDLSEDSDSDGEFSQV